MKKYIGTCLLSLCMFILSSPVCASEARVQVDGTMLEDTGVIISGRTLLPVRAVGEALGAEVGWDDSTQTVSLTHNGDVIQLTIGSEVALVNLQPQEMDVPSQIINGMTKIPIRFAAEALGIEVAFDGEATPPIVVIRSGIDPASPPIASHPYTLEQAMVARVIDGDTIELGDGEVVRLIGIDAPEIGQAGAAEATAFVTDKAEGATVWLEADGNNRDAFGRLRRYVWLQYPTNPQDEAQIRQYQLNALLLEAGHASVLIVGSPRNEDLFRQLAGDHTPPNTSQYPPTDEFTTTYPQLADGSVARLSYTQAVGRGNTARVTLDTQLPGEWFELAIRYASGYGSAAGLGRQAADSQGVVTWSWQIGRNTATGNWPATITLPNGEVIQFYISVTQ